MNAENERDEAPDNDHPAVVSPSGGGGGGGTMEMDSGVESRAPKDDVSLNVGGPQTTEAFALLDGIQQDPDSGKKERVTVPITRLPAVLGRSHDTKDSNFFGLGTKKAVSRNHFTIFYRDIQGGCVEWDESKSKLQYHDKNRVETAKKKLKLTKERMEADLPSHGFFVLECLGKNPIRVDGEKVEQGECMVLESGCSLRISSYMLYFLLPTDAQPQPHKVHLQASSSSSPKKKKASAATAATSSSKKRPIAAPSTEDEVTPTKKPNLLATVESASEALQLPITQQSDLDSFSTEMLLEMMEKVVTAGIWERKHQIIGSAIALRAVVSAAEAPEVQEAVLKNPGVSRQELMEWIEKSDTYGAWVKQMMSNMESRSYVASITKSLLKSGWTRTDGQGRYVKWKLPPDTKIVVDVKEETSKDMGKETEKKKAAPSKEKKKGTLEEGNEKGETVAPQYDRPKKKEEDGNEEASDSLTPSDSKKDVEVDKEQESASAAAASASASVDTDD